MTIELKINLRRYPQLVDKLNKLKIDSPEETRLYRKMYYGIKEKAWPEAYYQSNLRVRSGVLLRDTTFGKAGKAKYYFSINAPHAKFIWWGTAPSRGRYIPKYEVIRKGRKVLIGIGKRISKRNMPYLAQKYGWAWVGWHPGVKTYNYPLRTNMIKLARKYAKIAFVRWYNELIRRL